MSFLLSTTENLVRSFFFDKEKREVCQNFHQINDLDKKNEYIENIDFVFVDEIGKISTVISKLKESGYDAILIDTVGTKEQMSTKIGRESDLVLIPCKEDIFSVKAAMLANKLVNYLNKVHSLQIQPYVVMMDVDDDTTLTAQMIQAMESQNIPRLPVVVKHLTGFKNILVNKNPDKSGPAFRNTESLMYAFQSKGLIDFYKGE